MRLPPRHSPQTAIQVGVTLLAACLALADLFDWPYKVDSPTTLDLLVLGGSLLLLTLLASGLGSLRSPRAWARCGNFQAQAIFRTVSRRLAPPMVAGALALSHTPDRADAMAVFAAMLVVTFGLSGTRYPLHLAGVARLVFDLVMPAAGIGLAVLVAAIWQVDFEPGSVFVPLLGAWFITFAGGWLEEAFNAQRPIRMAVVGEPRLAAALSLEMEGAGVSDHQMIGWISAAGASIHAEDHGFTPPPEMSQPSWIGSLDDVRNVVSEQEIDLLVMIPAGLELFQQTIEGCVDLPVRMVQASRLYEDMHGRVPIGAINAAWFAYIMHPRFSPQAAWSKRLMDLLIAGTMFLLLLPLFAIVALAVKLGDGGPVFFTQRRVGARGREFDVMKFRTMGIDAEEPGKPQWAQVADPRVTRVGRFLRVSHLDEMPQLLNVLGGSMSMVGPRPERPEFVSDLERTVPYYSRRVLVKPGITGWAQVRSGYGGSELGTAFKVCHDLYYIKHRSLLFDLLTLVETVRTLVADVNQYGQFTFSEAFIVGPAEITQEAAGLGQRAVLGDTARISEHVPAEPVSAA